MSTYKFDENGRVISEPSQYDMTTEQERQIVDGNSVNYADNSNDAVVHENYDSKPVSKYDPEIRHEVGENWKSPSGRTDKKDYFNVDKSTQVARDLLKNDGDCSK